MTTQSTPEQLAKWREEFEKTETNPYLEKTVLGMYAVTSIENRWQGYLRAKQETEQAMKLARFGAMVIRDPSNGSIDKREILQYAILADVISDEIEATIKELLND